MKNEMITACGRIRTDEGPTWAAELRELAPEEFEGVEGGFWPLVAAIVVGGAILLYPRDAW